MTLSRSGQCSGGWRHITWRSCRLTPTRRQIACWSTWARFSVTLVTMPTSSTSCASEYLGITHWKSSTCYNSMAPSCRSNWYSFSIFAVQLYYILYLFKTKSIIYIKCMYIHIYKCRQITIRDHNSGISGENANEPSNSFKRFRKSKHSSEILPSNALLLCAPPVFNIYSTLIFSQHVIFLWSTNVNSSGYYIVIDITYQFLSNIDVTLMLSMSVFSKIL